MITRQNDPIFFIYFLSFIHRYNSFPHFKTIKIQFHGVPPPFALCSKHILHAKDDTFKLGNIDIFFLQKISNVFYITCFVPKLILIWPRSHGLSALKKVLKHLLPSTSFLILVPSLAPFSCFFSN